MTQFDNSYARLPQRFFTRRAPEPSPQPSWIRFNAALATSLGLSDAEASAENLAFFSGVQVPDGADPIATVYAGHQFGGWSPQLGDGRAVLLGEVLTPGGERFDVQLKGSGRTPYSRGGDGKAPLGPVLREYVVSEAMHALGVPTSRALAAVRTGEAVRRQGPLPGALLTRVARSHIRVGTFEFFASRGDTEALTRLAYHVIHRHYPRVAEADHPVAALLAEVVDRQASLIARWQLLGFIHGVMNTDNMLVSGETIDYGPCAFMDHFDPATVFSSIDHRGRYAYQNQPGIGLWNLARLAQALLPILGADDDAAQLAANDALSLFEGAYQQYFQDGLRRKLGLSTWTEGDDALAKKLWATMETASLDFTLTFRRLSELACPDASPHSVAPIADAALALDAWLPDYRARLASDDLTPDARAALMTGANPALIPRNHLVEAAINAATTCRDDAPFHALVDALASPFDYTPDLAKWASPPRPGEEVQATFCGT